jgi:hypothetical protein
MAEVDTENLTESEAQEILRQFTEQKANLHTFLTNVIKSPDTTRVGNLNEEELGLSILPLRTNKELSLFCSNLAGNETWANYFEGMAQIGTSTSLSKNGFLLKIAITSKKESSLADVTPRKENKGWFKKKDKEENQGVIQ